MLKLYARLSGTAVRRALRGWPAALALLAYAVGLQLVEGYAAPFGIVGGFVVGIVATFLISSYLHLISLAVAGRTVRPTDFTESFGARFWDTMSVLFGLWIIDLGLGVLTGGAGERGVIVRVLAGLTMAVFFNAVPELIYLGEGRGRSFGLLMDSGRFITAHWPEWLGPNALFAAALLAPFGLLRGGSLAEHLLTAQAMFSLHGLMVLVTAIPLWTAPVVLLFVTWAMVFRGLLFTELASGGARRQRKWPP